MSKSRKPAGSGKKELFLFRSSTAGYLTFVAAGYKVKSERAVQFRKWATGILNTSSKVAGGEHDRCHRR